MRPFTLLLFSLLLLSPAVRGQETAYRSEIERWRASREAGLRADNGWLSVVGLFWLQPGANPAGRAEGSVVALPPGGPERLGAFHLEGTQVRFEPRDAGAQVNGAPARAGIIRTDAQGKPDTIRVGSLSLQAIERGGRVGIRVRDGRSERRRRFQGLHWYPVRQPWRLVARFVPYDPPRTIPIANVLGQLNDERSAGYVTFSIAGREYRLDALAESPADRLFFIFRDASSGETTYPAGRFLYADPPRDGRVVLDFNKAENPPCAYTEFATCPLPPRQNWLKVRIEAGEQYQGH